MAPVKGRGRAKKSDTDDSPAPSKPPAVDITGTTPVKRGRGRPPKDPSGLPQRILNPKIAKSGGVGRGRGRPPKDPNAPPKTPSKKSATSSTGRARGRPPGSGKKQGAIAKATALAIAGAESAGVNTTKAGTKTARGGSGKGRASRASRDEEDEMAEEELGGYQSQHQAYEQELGEDVDLNDAEADVYDDDDAAAEAEDGGE